MFLIILLLLKCVSCVDEVVDDRTIIQTIFNGTKQYDSDYSPAMFDKDHNIISGPVPRIIISASFYLRALKVDEAEQMLHLDFTFRQKWADSRLAFKNNPALKKLGKELPPFVNLPMSMYKQGKLWFPDTFFQNSWSIRRHDFEHPNVLVRIYDDGQILYSTRLNGQFYCPMNFDYFPFDRQTCLVDFASYGDPSHKTDYYWQTERPIQLSNKLHAMLHNFKLAKVEADICTSKTNTGTYACLRKRLILDRKSSGEFKLFVPGFTMVIMAWTAFLKSFDHKFRLPTGGALVAIYVYYYSVAPNNLPLGGSTFALSTWHQLTIAFLIMAVIKNIFIRNDTGLFSFRDLCNFSKLRRNPRQMISVVTTDNGEDTESITNESHSDVSFIEQYVSYCLKRLFLVIYAVAVVLYFMINGIFKNNQDV